ncbi:sPFH domain/Band 7 family protein [Clostridium sp. CAG:1193]|jgi:regulator of protease activity HflC (stomatin/prohibitin superfamily)|nr:sPFH domain/Band 7 family protein [Clostridium sp. CAG:1193]
MIYIIIGLLLVIVISGIRIVPQAHANVVERLGSYKETWGNGLHFKLPFIDKVASKLTLKEMVRDFDPQSVITKDNVTMMIDTVVYFQITDPKLYTYGVENPISAIENLTATTLRNIIGDLELDETLTSRDVINTRMCTILDEATDPWGIKINRIEVKNILPPKDIQEAMEKQMRAERERREAILKAEGDKKAQILRAEGEKESAILVADAKKTAQIKEAEGKAEAILKIKEAEANGIKLLKDAKADDAVLKLKSYETFAKVADGQATKIIIPSNLQDMTSVISVAKEIIKEKK